MNVKHAKLPMLWQSEMVPVHAISFNAVQDKSVKKVNALGDTQSTLFHAKNYALKDLFVSMVNVFHNDQSTNVP